MEELSDCPCVSDDLLYCVDLGISVQSAGLFIPRDLQFNCCCRNSLGDHFLDSTTRDIDSNAEPSIHPEEYPTHHILPIPKAAKITVEIRNESEMTLNQNKRRGTATRNPPKTINTRGHIVHFDINITTIFLSTGCLAKLMNPCRVIGRRL